ncbi:GNAT family N-acetyltransferase [Desulfitobacterium sp.]|uniref:GNAT family N-acetyltransferase n=1 Tax=Desulfitobacterium sp. TaxID=49981 RepID=UPI002B21B544|nr:GNAT family N-acetyltransferase [Desulfitobacterium sp.]MEA4902162.1 GNAT family N-acetyltransferase [Desulfitobacterium sp.]
MLHHYFKEEFPLILRPLRADDIEDIRRWRNLDYIRNNFISNEIITPIEQKEWFNKYKVIENDFIFIIEETNVIQKKIGTVSIYNFSRSSNIAEFGRFIIGEADAQGKGYGVRAAIMACELAFKQLGVEKLFLEVFADNMAGRHVYTKVGFREYDERMENGRRLIFMELTKVYSQILR